MATKTSIRRVTIEDGVAGQELAKLPAKFVYLIYNSKGQVYGIIVE